MRSAPWKVTLPLVSEVLPIVSALASMEALDELKRTLPALSIVSAESSVPFEPMLSSTVTSAVPAVSVKERLSAALATTSSRVMSPLVVVMKRFPVSVMTESLMVKVAPLPVSVMLSLMVMPPAPSKSASPSEEMAALSVAVPELVTVTLPLPVVVRAASRVSVEVLMSTSPPTFTAASNSTSAPMAEMFPIRSWSTSTVAAAPLKCTSPPLSMVKPAGTLPPFTPKLSSTTMLPVPAVSVST